MVELQIALGKFYKQFFFKWLNMDWFNPFVLGPFFFNLFTKSWASLNEISASFLELIPENLLLWFKGSGIFFKVILFSLITSGPDAAFAGKQLNVRHEQNALETVLKELNKSRTRMKDNLLRSAHDRARREERASILATTGGSPGVYNRCPQNITKSCYIGYTVFDRLIYSAHMV